MMFNFEEWSEKVFRVTAYMDAPAAAESQTGEHQKEMQRLWEELKREEKDEDVLFLKTVLHGLKDLAEGKLGPEQFETTLQGLRENLIPQDCEE